MSLTFTESVVLEKDECGKCGRVYALTQSFFQRARQYGGQWRCPYCNSPWTFRESDVTRLEKELRSAKCDTLRERQMREGVEKRLSEQEHKLDRLTKGVCPCCRRNFVNLQRHMKTKHPEFSAK